ncbi:MAG: phytanoyl-CoA dioxygenase family protein [Acidimicrobiales bacterium]
MSTIPKEFDPDFIKAKSASDMQMYRAERSSQEPMKSVLENNPEIYIVPPQRSSNWGNWEFKPGSYYDTTTALKHPYWADVDLPQPTKDIERLRADILQWGYGLVEDALSEEQAARVRTRVLEQAEGERLAGIAQKTPSGQNINCCVNKGECFELLIEHHPSVMQGGALVEQLLDEGLGRGWICTSLIAAMSLKGGVPQALHQDQSTGLEARNPMLMNVVTAVTDMDETNGGTLVIPGSHRALADAVREGKPVGKLPPAINTEAKAGTALVYDGRLLHGTGINYTDEPRIAMLNGLHKPWMRQQENWMLSVRPEVLRRASPKLLHRMGYQASTGAQTNEGHGFGARGLLGEAAGALAEIRLAADEGRYVRVGELGPDASEADLRADYTLREVVAAARGGDQSEPKQAFDRLD